MLKPILPALLLALALTPRGLCAQSFALAIEPGASSVALNSSFGIDLPGSAIGDYDPVDNPGGTRTLPGLFGGSGNQSVPMDLGLAGDTDHAGPPLGSFVLEADSTLLTVLVRQLELDLLGGGAARTLLTLSLSFDTFRTFAPDSLFIGGFPIDLPLGAQSLTDLLLVQTAPSTVGTLAPGLEPGLYDFAVLVPVELSFTVGLGGQDFPVGPLPIPLPLQGEVRITGDTAQVGLAFDLDFAQQIVDPLPGFVIEGVPFALPTILPPGATASLLLSAVIGSIDVALTAGVGLQAQGAAPCGFESYCGSNPNSTGQVAQLGVSGSPDVTDELLTFSAQGLPPGQLGFLVVSQGPAFSALYRGHQGSLCLGPPFTRLTQSTLVFDAAGSASLDLDFGTLPPHLAWTPGSTWSFQLWYRDENPMLTWNSSNAVRTRFCTAP